MRKLGLFLLVLVVFAACKKKSGIEIITENVPDNTKVEVFIKEIGKDTPTSIASGAIVGGKLSFENLFTEADEAFIAITENEMITHNVFFIGEPAEITIKFNQNDPKNSLIAGTDNNIQLQKFLDEMKPVVNNFNNFMDTKGEKMMLLAQTRDSNPDELKKLKEEYETLTSASGKIIEKYESNNRDKAIGLMMLIEMINAQERTTAEYQAYFDKYSETLKASKLGKKLEERLKLFSGSVEAEPSGLLVGDKLPEFKALTAEGKELTLTAFLEGKKLVLVDVWASWCGPCRQENPNLVKTYNTFHEKGFDIIGYSLDKDDASWKKAIEKDKLTWIQVSNLKFWQDPIVGDYNITAVPANYLIDSNGVILAMDLRGNELDEKLEGLLTK